MFEFIKQMYEKGKLTDTQVRNMAPKWITWGQVDEILGE